MEMAFTASKTAKCLLNDRKNKQIAFDLSVGATKYF